MKKNLKYPFYFYENAEDDSCGIVFEDLGLVITRPSKRQVYQCIQQEVDMHVEALKAENMQIPLPSNISELPLVGIHGGKLDVVEIEIDA